MKVNVVPVAPQFVPQVRSFVRDPKHTLAVDPKILHIANGRTHSFGPGLSLSAIPGLAQTEQRVAAENLFQLTGKIWSSLEGSLPKHDPAVDTINVAFASEEFWEGLTAGENISTTRVLLGGAKLGLSIYDLLTDLYPPLKAIDPYVSPIGFIVTIADKAYAIYLTKEPS